MYMYELNRGVQGKHRSRTVNTNGEHSGEGRGQDDSTDIPVPLADVVEHRAVLVPESKRAKPRYTVSARRRIEAEAGSAHSTLSAFTGALVREQALRHQQGAAENFNDSPRQLNMSDERVRLGDLNEIQLCCAGHRVLGGLDDVHSKPAVAVITCNTGQVSTSLGSI